MREVLEGLLWALIDEDDNVGATVTKGWNFARIVEALLRLPRPFATMHWDRVRGELGDVRRARGRRGERPGEAR